MLKERPSKNDTSNSSGVPMKSISSFGNGVSSVWASALLSLGLVALTTGCGVGTLAPVSNIAGAATSAAFGGRLYGGPVAVVGATVKLYATGCNSSVTTGAACTSDGYGVGQFLQEATQQGTSPGQDTNANGDFIFAGGYTCPAKQFAYIVATGGNGGGGVNSAIALVAAVGRCEDLSSSTVVYLSELSTVAAAYALGHFTTEYGTSGSGLVVDIGAPVTNNSQTYTDANTHSAGCVSNTFYTTAACPTTAAAGLYHAFLNAANLMPVLSYQPSAPSTIVTAGTTVVPPVVPNRLINSIGNAISACVNSSGPSSTACTIVLGAGKLNSVTPTNVFQALINIASNPTLVGTGYTPTTFLAAGTAIQSYAPALATAPTTDLSIAINYPKGLGATTVAPLFQGLFYIFSNGLDINDNEYIGNESVNGNGTANVVTFTSNGTLISFTPNEATSGMFSISPDAIGNVYTGNYGASPTSVQKWSTVNGVVASTPLQNITTPNSVWALAVDRGNNVWAGTTNSATSATGNVVEIPMSTANTATAVTVVNVNQSPASQSAAEVYGLGVDPDQNIWIADYTTTTGAVSVLQNTGTLSTPTYTFETGTGGTLVPAAVVTTSGTTVGGGIGPFGMAFVKNTNSATIANSSFIEWTSFYAAAGSGGVTQGETVVGLAPVTPTVGGTNSAEVTAVSAGTLIVTNSTASYLQFATSDGDGTVYGANKNGDDIMVIQNAGSATPGTPFYIEPCYMSTSSTACNTTFNGLREVNIDSTGSMWIAMGTVGNVLQIIGSAAPAWPLLSLGVLGRP